MDNIIGVDIDVSVSIKIDGFAHVNQLQMYESLFNIVSTGTGKPGE